MDWLKARKDIDPKRIGLVGHSEGGVVAPLAAVKRPDDVAFLVLMAGVGVPMDELLVRQGKDISRLMGQSEEDIAKQAQSQREMLALLEKAGDTAAAEVLVREQLKQQLAEYTPEQREAIGMTDDAIEAQAKVAATPWFRQLAAYDPGPTLRQVKCPVLAINGEKDLAGRRERQSHRNPRRPGCRRQHPGENRRVPWPEPSLSALHDRRDQRIWPDRRDVLA